MFGTKYSFERFYYYISLRQFIAQAILENVLIQFILIQVLLSASTNRRRAESRLSIMKLTEMFPKFPKYFSLNEVTSFCKVGQ